MADTVSASEFLTWAASVGIGFDSSHPDSDWLRLLPSRETSQYWFMPDDPYSIPHFLGTILDGLDRWEGAYLWPRVGPWPVAAETTLPNERVRDVIWHGAGLPDGWDGAAHVSHEEWSSVVAALFASLALGGDSCSDLFFIPDHGRQIVHAGHHDTVNVECADDARLRELRRLMDQAGYPLPPDLPDAT